MTENRVEELASDSEGMPDLEPAGDAPAMAAGGRVQSKGEKKIRKAVSKLGLTPVTNYNRVTMLKDKTIVIAINNPEIFSAGDAYLVFGEAKVDDTANQGAENMASQMRQVQSAAEAGASKAAPPVDDGPVDETGVEAKDIELVMTQAKCSRNAAVRALKNNDNDIVNAIMSLAESA
eukprot:GILI01014532.1.p1 GENE.GILI01014532.1~~GILI01014532.1.p1  ORF type:complete len:186 (-),score=62.59 GILI01014532.1:32-562(-)